MITYYIQSDDKDALILTLISLGVSQINVELNDSPASGRYGEFVLDWIGEIYEDAGVTEEVDTGEVDEFGDPIYVFQPIYASVGGYHCNIYSHLPLPESLEQYLVSPTPTTPARKLAGT